MDRITTADISTPQRVPTELGIVLVVDDNPLIQGTLRTLLASMRVKVIVANNGQEALALLKQQSVDLIICDVMMPKMDGYELYNAVRENENLSFLPFVFLTGLHDADEKKCGFESGVDDYLTKPFEPAELLALVKGKLKRSQEARQMQERRYDSFRKKVVHTLSHEFRTPLVAINTGTELLLANGKSLEQEKVGNLLSAISRSGRRLERLITDFMLLQQIEAGIAQRLFCEKKQKIAVSEFILQGKKQIENEFHQEGFLLTAKDYSNNAVIDVYCPHMLIALEKVLINAKKFSKYIKVVEIVCTATDREAIVEIRDRGVGFNQQQLKTAISMFGQLDRESQEQQGSGLGLTIANHYVIINGGALRILPREGGGSIVEFALPLS